jgi:hypothetical protein
MAVLGPEVRGLVIPKCAPMSSFVRPITGATSNHPSEGDCGAILEVAADDLRADRPLSLWPIGAMVACRPDKVATPTHAF